MTRRAAMDNKTITIEVSELAQVWNGGWQVNAVKDISKQISDLLNETYFAGREVGRAEYSDEIKSLRGQIKRLNEELAASFERGRQ